MAAKPRFRIRSVALAATATAICLLATASPTLAATGSVYFDNLNNAAAGGTLFNGTFSGVGDVGIGSSVMPSLTTGSENTATGTNALGTDNNGSENVASGTNTLISNTTGNGNVATGTEALKQNNGDNNAATGTGALPANTTGDENVATGYHALLSNTTGNVNLALGAGAGQNLTTGSDNIDLANAGKAGEQRVMRLGTKGDQTRTYIAGISGRTVNGTGQTVVVNAQGQLGTASSASAKPLSAATGKRLLATVQRLQHQNRRQGQEIRKLRARG